jgi:hypothetical protein
MIDLVNYFDKGFDVTKLAPDTVTKLWQIVYTTEWTNDESGYKAKPDWYQAKDISNVNNSRIYQGKIEREYGRELLDNSPKDITDVAQHIINSNFFSPLKVFKTNTELKYVHLWNGAEDISWHSDAIDGSDMLILIYLTEELQWDNSWGGCIEIAKDINDEKLYQTMVQPLSGNMVIINNANPLVKHRVHALTNQTVNRYTFNMCFNWLS